MKWIDNLRWYVLNHDFNANTIERYNIFNNSKLYDFLEKYFKKFITFEDFKEKLRSQLMYCFWSKVEYEIACSGLLAKNDDERYKIDVFYQLELNIDILAKYIIDSYNNRPYARKRINTDDKS